MTAEDCSVVVSGLSVKFDDFYAVKNISFSVKKGEVFGFLGANGAGKTTTIRVLCGLITPTEGSVAIGGTLFKDSDSELAIKKKVGYMSQKFTLYNDLSIEENLRFIASIRKLNRKTYLKRRDFLLSFIAFKKSLKSLVYSLSGGTKQKVSLAAALLHDPDIIFLDEPTAGVTPASRARFWELIKELSSLGKTIFVTTHYMDEAENCERIALMNMGAMIALDSPAGLKARFFPDKLYEFYPKKSIKYAEIEAIRHWPEFDFFEPFGLRFHATFKQGVDREVLNRKISGTFDIKPIAPTLEDVFIKAIEGANT